MTTPRKPTRSRSTSSKAKPRKPAARRPSSSKPKPKQVTRPGRGRGDELEVDPELSPGFPHNLAAPRDPWTW